MKEAQLDVSNKIIIEIEGIKYSINEDDKTASVLNLIIPKNEISIPRSIKYKSQEYIITSVLPFSFKDFHGDYIKFDPDSEIRTIEPNSFSGSEIHTIEITSIHACLKEGWCSQTYELENVILNPDNPRYKVVEGSNIILGKTDTEQNHYNKLIFVPRFQKTISIPNTIEIIDSYAFEGTLLESVLIPPQVTQICEGSFANCKRLKNVIIEQNSKLQMIGKKAFYNTLIKSLTIPSNCTELNEKCFVGTKNLEMVNVSSDNNRYFSIDSSIIIDKTEQKLVYCCTKKKHLEIPNYVKIIGKNAFYQNKNLCSIQFPSDSKIEIIDDCAFYDSEIESISIPSQITKVGKKAFCFCKKLIKVDLFMDSKLQVIESKTFCKTSIEKISIPSQIKEIANEAFYSCNNLHEIEFSKDSKLKVIGEFSFEKTNIDRFTMPSETIEIGKAAFFECKNLHHLEIPDDSKLQIIYRDAFAYTQFEEFFIPSKCEELKEGWNSCINVKKFKVHKDNKLFSTIDDQLLLCKSNNDKEDYDFLMHCATDVKCLTLPKNIEIIGPYSFNHSKIETINFLADSKLKIIGCNSFSYSSIEFIKIPPHVTFIDKYAFAKSNLQEIDFSCCTELERIEDRAFYFTALKDITIPSSVTYIGASSFCDCKKLIHVGLLTNSQIKTIGNFAFSGTSIESFYLPSKVTIINSGTFFCCFNLENFFIPPDSELQIIGRCSFESTHLGGFTFPSKLRIIEEMAFASCTNLEKFEFDEDSQLEKIEYLAISGATSLKQLILPKKLKYFDENLSKSHYLSEIKYGSMVIHHSDTSFCAYPDLENINLIFFIGPQLLIAEFGPNITFKLSTWDKFNLHHHKNLIIMVPAGCGCHQQH